MNLAQELRIISLFLIVCFFSVAGAAAYWAVTGSDTILTREDNPRLLVAEQRTARGSLYDQNEVELARSIRTEAGVYQREYLYPAMNSILGYFSLRYGTGGLETAFNLLLRDRNAGVTSFDSFFQTEILHRPRIGADMRLTLDLSLQEVLYEALSDYVGAVVIMRVPDGAILAILSQPTYDPNKLDSDWDTFITDPNNLFFNRAIQGRYQPGGLLQTPLLAAALLANRSFQTVTADASIPIQLGPTRVRCVQEPPVNDLNFSDAYRYGCPRPFILLAEDLNPTRVNSILVGFQFNSPPMLAGFNLEPTVSAATTDGAFLETILGQGRLTVSPLRITTMTAAMINQGNAPQPFILAGTRSSKNEAWQSAASGSAPSPILTASVARRIRELMMNNFTGPVQDDGWDQGQHLAQAFTGDGQLSWFTGFGQRNTTGFTVTVVLENQSDPSVVETIGHLAMQNVIEMFNTR